MNVIPRRVIIKWHVCIISSSVHLTDNLFTATGQCCCCRRRALGANPWERFNSQARQHLASRSQPVLTPRLTDRSNGVP